MLKKNNSMVSYYTQAAITKMPLTGWLIHNKHLFLTGLEAVKSKIKSLADLVSGRDPLSQR